MIKISQVKLPLKHTEADMKREISRILGCKAEQIESYEIRKCSLDARKKENLHYSYVVVVAVQKEERLLKKIGNPAIVGPFHEEEYQIPECGPQKLSDRPVVVGSGPAGLFAAWLLAQRGLCPLVIERGSSVRKRTEMVEHFWKTGELSKVTNVQFGEGGAGTFSDGKLNTMVKDTYGRIRYMLQTFVNFGADSEILYRNKPHIGTDVLRSVVEQMRQAICDLGGEFWFETQLTGLIIQNGSLKGIRYRKNSVSSEKEIKQEESLFEQERELNTKILIIAIGHSARDTFSMLQNTPLRLEAKAFAAGVRVEHPQEWIDQIQYGESREQLRSKGIKLPAADYKVTHTCRNGRGVYSFCMCPGGYVVNASSEERRLVVNGMSNHARDGRNANSALIVTVTPEDFGEDSKDVLAGVEFQRKMEHAAYELLGGKVPVQLYGDFKEKKDSSGFGKVIPDIKGSYSFGALHTILPDWMQTSLIEGMEAFGQKIHGFNDEEAVFSGVETRTSSPVRILRHPDSLMAEGVEGIYPCGEGAGYAGGITSAAVDGIKVAEAIIRKYHYL